MHLLSSKNALPSTTVFVILMISISMGQWAYGSSPVDQQSFNYDIKGVHRSLSSETSLRAVQMDRDLPVIRVMFLALPSLKNHFSDFELDSEVNKLIDQTNQAFLNSGISAAVETAYVGPWPLNNGSQLENMSAASIYNSLHGPINQHLWGKGLLADVHQADVIFVLDYRQADDSHCGWASIDNEQGLLNQDVTYSYGVIRLGPGCGARAYILAHELGHLLGAAHGPEQNLVASAEYGYAASCGNKNTIMHQNFPKTPYYSGPTVSHEGVVCGNYEMQNNVRLLNDRAVLLAAKNGSIKSHTMLVAAKTHEINVDNSTAILTVLRGGDLREASAVDWSYANVYKKQGVHLEGGELFFPAGASKVNLQVDIPKGLLDLNGEFVIYLKNAVNLLLNQDELTVSTRVEYGDSFLAANFSLDYVDDKLVLKDISQSEFGIASSLWIFADGSKILSEPEIPLAMDKEVGEVTLQVTDVGGRQDSVSLFIDTSDSGQGYGLFAQAGSEQESFAQADSFSEPNAGRSGGGSLSIPFLLLWVVCAAVASRP